MYQCRCETCETVRVFEGLERAQTAFNDHVAERHEVVLDRVEMPAEADVTASDTDVIASDTDRRDTAAEE